MRQMFRHGWRTKFSGLQVNEAKRLRELEAENANLDKLLAEAHLDKEALKVTLGGKGLAPQTKREVVEDAKRSIFQSAERVSLWGFQIDATACHC